MNSAPTPTRREHLFRRRSTALILSGFVFLLTIAFNASADLISTYAGGPSGATTSNITNGIPATNALLNGVYGLATDLIGNLYLAPNSWSPAGAPTQQPDGSWRLDVAPLDPVRFYRFKSP